MPYTKNQKTLENGSPSAGSDSPNEGDMYVGDEEQEEILGSDEEEQEDPKDYRRGGYHPVSIGDVFHGRWAEFLKYFLLCN